MVFLTPLNLARSRGPDRAWRKRMYLRMSWLYYGRKRQCFSIAVRSVRKAMMYSTNSRYKKRKVISKIWRMRIGAACGEHSLDYSTFMNTLAESNIALNRKVLADLAIYEPRTFQSLTVFVKQRVEEMGLTDALKPRTERVLTRAMLDLPKSCV
ncbi:39S ribosomal protein L20, mitochondrial-like [Mizuhopecten yessoensis]|uniref:39S ribosomal protein L20, mitochondrial-like n=1 Tax=Mizuhopecten yessoensis TaxID=6573 RepID=UPI000B45DC66|nr:39S ribosomal protein L20, mitochondrial-like [Mizuhopecten yessoensis]XP_021368954.1 39S ribosomal protein L20, mitochondrial-like [Mizuhopecten yessoensis]